MLAALAAEEALKKSIAAEDFDRINEDVSQDSIAAKGVNKAEANVANQPTDATDSSKDKPCLNWVLDSRFKKEQTRLKIPEDPNDWTIPQVKHWFQWAVREFDLVRTFVEKSSI